MVDALASERAARVAAEKERDEAREIATRESVIASSALSRATAAESRAARLAHAGAEFASQYGASAFDCRYDNSCDDSGREPRCEPCELRAAIAAEEGK